MTCSLPLEKRHHLSQHFAVFRAFGPAAVPFLGSSLTLSQKFSFSSCSFDHAMPSFSERSFASPSFDILAP